MLTHGELCALIPHAGSMCLLERVVEWDPVSILCEAQNHRSSQHPLVRRGCLSSLHALEYAAQAMAVHGGLLARQQNRSLRGGYLAALREVVINSGDLLALQGALSIRATQLMAQGGNLIYQFEVSADGGLLVSGRATVIETQQAETGASK